METDKIEGGAQRRPPTPPPPQPDPYATIADETIAVRGRHAWRSVWLQVHTRWSRLTHSQQALAAACLVFACLLIQANVSKVAHRLAHWMARPKYGTDQKTLVLLECPVCHQAVDPKTSEYLAEIGSKQIYFDRMECLTAFQSDPKHYAHVRFKVKIEPLDNARHADDLPPSARETPTDTASSSSDDLPMPPSGGPPEPPSADPPPMDKNAAATKGRGPIGDAPLELPPAAAPDAGPAPKVHDVTDAPSVDEAAPPSDVPKQAPSQVPSYNVDGANPGFPPAPIKKRRHAPALPSLDGLPGDAVPPPPSASELPPADPNGFALPPSMNDGLPSRKTAPVKKKRVRTTGLPADAPSVDEKEP